MKKRILYSVIITVLFSLILMSSYFLLISNLKNINTTKQLLKDYSKFIISNYESNNYNFDDININGLEVNFEFIKIYDDNDKFKFEIEEIVENDEITSLKYNEEKDYNEVLYGEKISSDTVFISSVEVINLVNKTYVFYYFIILIVVILLSTLLGSRLIKVIIYPIKELEYTTNKITSGEYGIRVRIKSDDEFGLLGRRFNYMAEQLELKVKDSEDKKDKLEAILESMESGVIALDSKNRVMIINQYAKGIFDIKEDIIGKNFKPYVFDYDVVEFITNKKILETKEVNLIYPMDRIVRLKKSPIISYKNIPSGIVITIQDITDIKRLENIRSQFVANVSHELKTPLTSIKGFSETLRYVEDEETKNKFLDIIDKESDRLSNLINDILILSKIENTYKMKDEKFSKIDIINEVIDVVKPQLDEKNINVVIEKSGNSILIGDEDKFYQMVLNLISNAIKYSHENKTIKIRSYDEKQYSVVEIEDQGFGIPKEDIPRIFERFYIVDKSRSKKGTGLGLAIVKHIVKMFNGEIYVKSELGVGSTFTIKIRKR